MLPFAMEGLQMKRTLFTKKKKKGNEKLVPVRVD